jgi:hypothetical protein
MVKATATTELPTMPPVFDYVEAFDNRTTTLDDHYSSIKPRGDEISR